ADLHDGPRAAARRAGGALPRHPRHPRERADALVLCDADHLPVLPGQRAEVPAAVQREPVHAPGHLVSGDPVLLRADWPLELAAPAGRRLGAAVPRVLLGVRSAARFVCGGGVNTTERTVRTETRDKSRHMVTRETQGPYGVVRSVAFRGHPLAGAGR